LVTLSTPEIFDAMKLQQLRTLLRRPAVDVVSMPAETVWSYHGYVDAVSDQHVAGWVHNTDKATETVLVEVGLKTTGEVLVRGHASNYYAGLRKIGIGNGEHGFSFRLPRRLTEEEQDAVVVRPVPGGEPLTRSTFLATQYNPIQYIIMDIVDNCNLRCPFCLVDYSGTHTTNMMSEATFDAALRFAPYVTEGNFWFSCLHEPTLHPRLMAFIDKVPRAYRSKLFYTTNLAKRMPVAYFEALADSGMHHVNISIESLDPPIYEKMRKGARFPIFKENWDRLVDAFGRGSAVPKLRYISLAYKSTFRQLPELIDYLLRERRGSIVEVRDTYDEPHIPRAFRQAEYMGRDEWLWLRDQLAHYTAEQVMLVLPAGVEDSSYDAKAAAWSERVANMYDTAGRAPPAIHAAPPEPFRGTLPKQFLQDQYGVRLFWDGRLEVSAVWGDPDQPAPPELRLVTTNVRDIGDVEAFFSSLLP
jgi:hypothetical protein